MEIFIDYLPARSRWSKLPEGCVRFLLTNQATESFSAQSVIPTKELTTTPDRAPGAQDKLQVEPYHPKAHLRTVLSWIRVANP